MTSISITEGGVIAGYNSQNQFPEAATVASQVASAFEDKLTPAFTFTNEPARPVPLTTGVVSITFVPAKGLEITGAAGRIVSKIYVAVVG